MRQRKSMRVWSTLAALLVAAALTWWQRPAENVAGAGRSEDSLARSAGVSAVPVQDFDYYVLSLSWSPQHCATEGRDDAQQCGTHRRYGFIVHGLWPQYERSYPENCGGDRRVSRREVERMLDLMPSEQLIRHEWARHGTCSGLDQDEYFDTVRAARAAVNIPESYRSGTHRVQTTAAAVRGEFLRSNPGWDADTLVLRCDGQYLAEVRLCMDRQLNARACGADVRPNCRTKPLIVRPLR